MSIVRNAATGPSKVAFAHVVANKTVCYRRNRAAWQVTAHAAARGGPITAEDAACHRERSTTFVEDAAANAAAVAGIDDPITTDDAVHHRQVRIAGVDASSFPAENVITINRGAGHYQCRAGIVADAAAQAAVEEVD